MDGHDCDIKSETCHRADKVKERWVSTMALNDMLFFGLVRTKMQCLQYIYQAMGSDGLDKWRGLRLLRMNGNINDIPIFKTHRLQIEQ